MAHHRKIWVKRPGASATLVQVNEGDLVDDVRDTILKKYTNTLGRSFDAPDVTLRIISREPMMARGEPGGERTLGPEEAIGRTLDGYFPGGQTVDEALIIDVPVRRTPRPSPRNIYYADEIRPGQQAGGGGGGDYFPPMPAIPSPHLPTGSVSSLTGPAPVQHHTLVALNPIALQPLPSPGSTRSRNLGRPRMRPPGEEAWAELRSSDVQPTVVGIGGAPPPAPPILPNSPIGDGSHKAAGTPPRLKTIRKHRKSGDHVAASLTDGILVGAVPPINVLLVEDNIINLKLLEAFMKRLKVRWQTAMNGREAVTKWRAGGFHLVLMDIQLPVMNGLDATKEIRRLERINSIGLFSSSASSHAPAAPEAPTSEDKLEHLDLFKSPVIIVALTASSLQSDRHEALAAGCNDFLTKPVNYVWLERKVMEWGCMQALIDFDGWRKWKDFSSATAAISKAGGAGAADGKKNEQSKDTTSNNNMATPKASGGGGVKATTSTAPTTGGGGGGGGGSTTAGAAGLRNRLSRNLERENSKVIVAGGAA
ncbi:MAG: ssk1 response regulator receiver [Peltula sp. TS41687]|nr:MAG: ssk1 response regulator receiver [Peltula sp. TS41687]